ncbi:MAG: vWA domain-containing protein [Brevinema sp.]
MMNFENPRYLILLLIVPAYLFLKYTKYGRGFFRQATLPYSSLSLIDIKKDKFSFWVNIAREALLMLVISSLIVALARPRGGSAISSENNLGVDIVLLTDLSGSMAFVDNMPADAKRVQAMGAEIFIDEGGNVVKHSRLEIAKRVMKTYINKQNFNRIALVFFSSYAITKSPLTTDKALLLQVVDDTSFFEEGATAIGTGLLTALNRVRNSTAKSKVIILLTDGINNAGIVDPISAANVARELGIKIYTIGIGNTGGTFQVADNSGKAFRYVVSEDYDPETLQEIADITGGKFFAATSESTLQDVYNEIDSLEKSEFAIKRRVLYEEKFKSWLAASIFFMILWLALNFVVVKIP